MNKLNSNGFSQTPKEAIRFFSLHLHTSRVIFNSKQSSLLLSLSLYIFI